MHSSSTEIASIEIYTKPIHLVLQYLDSKSSRAMAEYWSIESNRKALLHLLYPPIIISRNTEARDGEQRPIEYSQQNVPARRRNVTLIWHTHFFFYPSRSANAEMASCNGRPPMPRILGDGDQTGEGLASRGKGPGLLWTLGPESQQDVVSKKAYDLSRQFEVTAICRCNNNITTV